MVNLHGIVFQLKLMTHIFSPSLSDLQEKCFQIFFFFFYFSDFCSDKGSGCDNVYSPPGLTDLGRPVDPVDRK